MKTTKIIALTVCLFFAGQIFAVNSYDSMRERTESWLQGSDEPALRGSRALDENESGVLEVPAKDAIYILLVLTGTYAMIRKRKISQNR